MTRAYLDNAATTPIHPEVIEAMTKSMKENYGNPSSVHQHGRSAKVIIESTRKSIAKQFNVSANEIVFTSGGTEANNFVLQNAVLNLGVKKIVTTRIEHNAVLNTVLYLESKYNIEVDFLDVDKFGNINLDDIKNSLELEDKKTLVSLMYVNNEIGNVLPIQKVAEICKDNKALFHSDTVQAVGLFDIDLSAIQVDFITASAHKFHGPKGVGFVFVRKGVFVHSVMHGGSQEKALRPGTENLTSILGMHKAFQIAYKNVNEKYQQILTLKKYFFDNLKKEIPDISFNGMSADFDKSTPTVLNVRFPINDQFFLLNLDIEGVSASAGSACQSGAMKTSHVLKNLLNEDELSEFSIRFSFGLFTTSQEIDFSIEKIKKLILK